MRGTESGGLVGAIIAASSVAPTMDELAESMGIGIAELDRIVIEAFDDGQVEPWTCPGPPPWIGDDDPGSSGDRVTLSAATVARLNLVTFEVGRRQTPRWIGRKAEARWHNRRRKPGHHAGPDVEDEPPVEPSSTADEPLAGMIGDEADVRTAAKLRSVDDLIRSALFKKLPPLDRAALRTEREVIELDLKRVHLIGSTVVWPVPTAPGGKCGCCGGRTLDPLTYCLACSGSGRHSPPSPPPIDVATARRTSRAVARQGGRS